MQFFGAFTLLVLPLFLFVCTQMIKNTREFSKTIAAKIVIGFFYFMAVLCLGTAVYLITKI